MKIVNGKIKFTKFEKFLFLITALVALSYPFMSVFAKSTISLNDSSSTDDANKNSYANISVKLSLDTAFLGYQKKNVAIINKYNTVPTNASTVGSGAFQQKEDK